MTSRNVSLDYLRAGLTVLVIAFHSAMAYHPSAPSPHETLLTGDATWELFPVVDPSRWQGFAYFFSYCDAFFMSAMFFLSGLFVWDSLGRKGAGGFLRDRAVRLGLPFMVAAFLLSPVAYYPSYLQTGARGIAGFWAQWTTLDRWPAGPAWFLWLLLAFNAVAAGLQCVVPEWGPWLGRLVAPAGRAPVVVFATFVALGVPAYVAMELNYPWWQWSSFGPFWFQTSRIAQYFLYFVLGIGIGSLGLTQGLLAPDGRLARRWPLWVVSSLLAFALSTFVTSPWFAQHPPERTWEAATAAAYALSCAASRRIALSKPASHGRRVERAFTFSSSLKHFDRV